MTEEEMKANKCDGGLVRDITIIKQNENNSTVDCDVRILKGPNTVYVVRFEGKDRNWFADHNVIVDKVANFGPTKNGLTNR